MSNALKRFGGAAFSIGLSAITGGWGSALKSAGILGVSALLSGSQRTQGARLTELGIQLSQEGAEIPRFWGHHRQALNIIWPRGPALTEHKKTSSSGGKGGPKQDTFTYTATFAALGGKWQITRIEKIIADTSTVYDYNGGSELGFSLSWDDSGFWYGEHPDGWKVRIYPGTLDQPVDSKIEAVEGVNQWTNYPGCWYLVFEDLPTNNGQIPTITVQAYNSVTAVSDIILEVGGWVGLTADDFDLSALDGLAVDGLDGEGYSADSRKSAADIIAELGEIYHFWLVEEDFVLRAKMKNAAPVKTLSAGELRIYSPGGQVPDTQFPQADEKTLPKYLEQASRDPGRNYQTSHRVALWLLTASVNITSENWNANLRGNHLDQLGRIRIAQMHANSNTVQGTLGLENSHLTPGDAIGVPSPDGVKDIVLSTVNLPLFGPAPVTGMVRDRLAYSIPLPGDTAALDSQPPVVAGAPTVFIVETVPLSENPDMVRRPGFIAGATITDNENFGSVVFNVERIQGDGWKEHFEVQVPYKAVIGELTADFTPTPPTAGHVATSTMSVQLYSQELNSTTLENARGGANLMVLRTGLACTFCNATLESTDSDKRRTYTLDTIKCGRRTSDDFDIGTIAAGTQFMMITDSEGIADPAVKWIELSPAYLGLNTRIRATNPATTIATLEPFLAINLQEPKPTILSTTRDGGLRLRGRMRNRFPDQINQIRMTATPYPQGYKYRIRLTVGATERFWDKFDTDPAGRFDITISDSELTAAFGSVPDPGDIDGTIAIYGPFGPGRAREFESV